MSAEQGHLRTTLIGSLLDITRRNLSRAATSVAIFEAGAVYLPTSAGELPREPHHVAALMTGPLHETTWRSGPGQPADFFVAKGVLESMLGTLRVEFEVGEVSGPFLHPGRRASLLVDGGREVGWLGEIHPSVAALWEIDATVAAFELDLDAVGDLSTPMFEDMTSFPEVREDLAIVVDETIATGGVIETVMRAGAPLISSARVFDVYRDAERLGAGKVSLALALTYRAPDRTLTDAEVAQRRAAIVAAIGSELKGTIRGG
jgi:phenylalanyl-tRNA synthetase beta chain